MISRRARQWSEHDAFLVKAHFTCMQDPFDPEENPNGYVNFGTAENKLVYDLLEPMLQECGEIHESDTHYNQLHGARHFRKAIAQFLSRLAGRTLSSHSIVVASGASAILEILSFTLCDAGDGILIPTPYYTGFDHDLAFRSEAKMVPVPSQSPDFKLTIENLQEAHATAVSEGTNVRTLLLNSPQNPLGQVYSEQLVRDLISFAKKNDLHIILDEIYAESLMPGVKFFSGLSLESPLVHVVYGFAKDFGISGWKVGVLHTQNEEVLNAARDSAYFHTVSAQTQRTLTNLLRHPQLESFFGTMRERLAESYRHVTGLLEEHSVRFVPVEGGIVLWMDLRRFLPSDTFEGEREFFEKVFGEYRVSISPGSAFHCSEPGWFRLCFTVPESHRTEGLNRLFQYLESAG